jgi:hypothetical protein
MCSFFDSFFYCACLTVCAHHLINIILPAPFFHTTRYYRGVTTSAPEVPLSAELKAAVGDSPIAPGGIRYVLHTRPGPGPQVLDASASLLDDSGLPK